jgi:hypothetical protein
MARRATLNHNIGHYSETSAATLSMHIMHLAPTLTCSSLLLASLLFTFRLVFKASFLQIAKPYQMPVISSQI